jgi:putative membrane protein (TIGR04086 family)
MTRLSVKGTVIGAIVDVAASSLVGIPLAVFAMLKVGALHLPREQASAAVAALIHTDPGLRSAQLLVGVLCSVFGGFLAAWIAKHDELLNGAASSFLCVAIGVFSLIAGKTPVDGYHIMLIAISPALGILGGYLGMLRASRHTTAAV